MSDQTNASPEIIARVVLRDGTHAVIRPLRPDSGAALTERLHRLSPESRYNRFLSAKGDFAPDELEFLTHPDGVNHLALVLAITDAEGNEQESVAVVRCVRDPTDRTLAEMAIVVMDDWQGRGIGKILCKALAARSYRVGIRRWRAVFLSDNVRVRKLMQAVGTLESEHFQGHGVVEGVFVLEPPDS